MYIENEPLYLRHKLCEGMNNMGYFNLDVDKALNCILYVASKAQPATRHKIAKILYEADKLHLERYGRFISGDEYIAMEYGPVPTATYDMIKASTGETNTYSSIVSGRFVVEGNVVKPICDVDCDEFSDSDIKCLDEAIKKLKGYSFTQRTEHSHDLAWENTTRNAPISIELIAKTLPNSEDVLGYLVNPHP